MPSLAAHSLNVKLSQKYKASVSNDTAGCGKE